MAIHRIWEGMDEIYGAPEMVMLSLKKKLAYFPTLTKKGPSKLYLVDILENEKIPPRKTTKAVPKFGPLLPYQDTSSGINPIVMKLPVNLRDRLIGHAVRSSRGVFPSIHEIITFRLYSKQSSQHPVLRQRQRYKHCLSISTGSYPEIHASNRIDFYMKDRCRSASRRCPKGRTVPHSLCLQFVDCKAFLQKTILQRRKILSKSGLQMSQTWTL